MTLDAEWSGAGGSHTALLSNLSEGGCYLDTVGETRIGDIVGFRIALPDGDWLYLEGEVRHHTPGVGFGVMFVDLNDEQQALVKALLLTVTDGRGEPTPIAADLVE